MPHPTHDALLDAGLRLAEQHGLSTLSVNAVVAAAEVAKGTFYVHFQDRTAFLVALHQRFHDHLKTVILEAIRDLPPGRQRLQIGTIAYLDGCLHELGVKAMLFDSRGEPAIAEQVRRRNAEFSAIAAADFEAMGWDHPTQSARLYIVMVAEAAIMELESGQPDRGVRNGVFAFLD
jgi:AcrR family transcriptional regulator